MNLFKRLFKKKIEEKELDKLILNLGKDKRYLDSIYGTHPDGYITIASGYLDVKQDKNKIVFDLDIFPEYVHKVNPDFGEDKLTKGTMQTLTETLSYQEVEKNPVLRKYVKKRNLESSLSILSIALILASTFFISNNITGNAILTATPNSSGIIGAGLFVLGAVSFILARNI